MCVYGRVRMHVFACVCAWGAPRWEAIDTCYSHRVCVYFIPNQFAIIISSQLSTDHVALWQRRQLTQPAQSKLGGNARRSRLPTPSLYRPRSCRGNTTTTCPGIYV